MATIFEWVRNNKLPELPRDYYWEDVAGLALVLRHRVDGEIGYFTLQHDPMLNRDKWVWRHNFRRLSFDTLDEAIGVVLVRHKLGGINNNRQVF